ncbi:hypothetical protein [Celeribacter halophilus]|uniref:hypothetical protein n=1 Tax=Celeribacter halophilus TaxID=576117 RepID=UPI003A905D67
MTLITNRRSMLLGLVTATTAAVTGNTASGAPTTNEAPELLALADQLEGTLQAHMKAKEEVARIVSIWGPQWPKPDSRIIRYGADCKTHRDIEGRGIETEWGPGIMRVQDLGTPEHFEKSAAHYRDVFERKMKTKSQRGAKGARKCAERDASLIEPARAYWSEVDRIEKSSGIKEAIEAVSSTQDALKKLVGNILTFHERTITGLIIKAQAMQAWSKVDQWDRKMNPDALKWADAMNDTILRQTASA